MKVLIIEDNKILSSNISKYLEINNIKSNIKETWKQWIYELASFSYDLVLLDLGLPDIDWLEVCKYLRDKWNSIPILMLTSRSMIKDKLSWFDSWADDYLTKPFDYEELLARIKTLIRRNFSLKSKKIVFKDLELLEDDKKVVKSGLDIHLSSLEFDLLLYLLQNKWKLLSKEKILEKVWGEYDAMNSSRTLDVYIWYLRKKLWKEFIETKRGRGYIIS